MSDMTTSRSGETKLEFVSPERAEIPMRFLVGAAVRNYQSSAPFPWARAAERHKGISVYRPHQWSLYDSLLFSVRLPSVLVVKCPEVRFQSCLPEPSSSFPSETKLCVPTVNCHSAIPEVTVLLC